MKSLQSNFEVPADRPHFAVWPRRLPRALIAPETSLWFNAEVAAARYPDKPAYVFFGRTLTFRGLPLAGRGDRRLAAERGRRQRRSRRRLHAELPAVRGRALRRAACQRGGRARQPDESGRGGSSTTSPTRRRASSSAAPTSRPSSLRRRRRCRSRRAYAASSSRATPTRCPKARSTKPTHRRRRWTRGCAATPSCPRAMCAGPMRWPPGSRPARTPRGPTTSRCCPTPRARPVCPRAACIRIAR